MYKLNELMEVIEGYAPLELSRQAIARGSYDNSGIIINSHDNVEKILFTLDLSIDSVKQAEKVGADTIITHHPAIYNPVKTLSIGGETAAVLMAARAGMNVISMHLNLDMAKQGIDYFLAKGLGAAESKILDEYGDEQGYGREFIVKGQAEDLLDKARAVFGSEKIILYGSGKVERAASFCGGGSDNALKAVLCGATAANLIVSSDIPHHVLKELIERDKMVMIIPHYVSENYGFEKFYAFAVKAFGDDVKAYYFLDKRFM